MGSLGRGVWPPERERRSCCLATLVALCYPTRGHWCVCFLCSRARLGVLRLPGGALPHCASVPICASWVPMVIHSQSDEGQVTTCLQALALPVGQGLGLLG